MLHEWTVAEASCVEVKREDRRLTRPQAQVIQQVTRDRRVVDGCLI